MDCPHYSTASARLICGRLNFISLPCVVSFIFFVFYIDHVYIIYYPDIKSKRLAKFKVDCAMILGMKSIIKYILTFLTNMSDSTYNGAFDDRSPEEKSKDFKWSEVSVLGEIKLEERGPKYSYTQRFQDGSGSCVAQSTAKMLEIWDFKHDNSPTVYSATPIYQKRMNRPGAGMVGVDALGLASDGNVFLEKDAVSQNLDDIGIDAVVYEAGKKQPEHPINYLVMPIAFDVVVQETQNVGATMVWFKSSQTEWFMDVPTGDSTSEAIRHSTVAVDAILWKGIEYIIIEDSYGRWDIKSDLPLKPGQRAISRAFFEKHCFFAAAFTAFHFDGGDKPKYYWAHPMVYGDKSEDVKQLQNVLKYEKFFPSDQESTGFFGGITAKALVKWQVSHGFLDFQHETDMRKVRAGSKSIALLNSLYK